MRKWFFLLVCLGALALSACGQPSTAPESQSTAVTGSEIPSEVQAKLDEYVIQDEDALASLAPGLPDLSTTSDDYDVYAVTYLWGSFFPAGGSALVWDGKTQANTESFIRVVTDIDFEDGEAIVFDSTQPSMMGWRSSTLHDLDGVSFLLFVKRGILNIVPPVLSFETTPISFSIPIESLAHHVSFHPVDHSSGVAVIANQIKRVPCPHGHLGGKWVFDQNTRASGHFEGLWYSEGDQVVGPLAGAFTTDTDGHRLLRGQVSLGSTTQVIIELEGIWSLAPHLSNTSCNTCGNVGYFVGRWKYLDGSGGGKFAGNFGEPDLSGETPELPFRGIWVQRCNQVAGDFVWSGPGQ